MARIELVRVYDGEARGSGAGDPGGAGRYLVERLWPRGIKRDALPMDGWLKDVAPSTELRKWFGHDPDRWAEFRRRYAAELDEHPDAWEPLAKAARGEGVTLLYSSRDTEHNNAVALREYLLDRVDG